MFSIYGLFPVSHAPYPDGVLRHGRVAVLGQDVGAGPGEVEVDSIKGFIVVLAPGAADPISVPAKVGY